MNRKLSDIIKAIEDKVTEIVDQAKSDERIKDLSGSIREAIEDKVTEIVDQAKSDERLNNIRSSERLADIKDAITKSAEKVVDIAKQAKPDERLKDIRSLITDVVDLALEKVPEAADALTSRMDELSGEKMYKEVEERLNLQDKYNDVIATKLHEALERIQKLEEIAKKHQG